MAENGNGSNGLKGWLGQVANVTAVSMALFMLYGMVEDMKQTNKAMIQDAKVAHAGMTDLTQAVEANTRSMYALKRVVEKKTSAGKED